MSDMDPEAAALLRAGRSAFRPDASDRDRVLLALSAALREGPVAGGEHPGRVVRAAHSLGAKSWLLGGLAAVALGVSAVVVLERPSTRSSVPASAPGAGGISMASGSTGPNAETPSADVPAPRSAVGSSSTEPAQEGANAVAPAAGSRTAPRSPQDALGEEVRLLSRAERQMAGGRAADALATLAEHARRFPTGVLAEDRMAARVQALCALGRTGEAEGERARLARAYPRSAHIDGRRAVCAGTVDAPP